MLQTKGASDPALADVLPLFSLMISHKQHKQHKQQQTHRMLFELQPQTYICTFPTDAVFLGDGDGDEREFYTRIRW